MWFSHRGRKHAGESSSAAPFLAVNVSVDRGLVYEF